MPKITINRDRCKGCEHCVHACPQGVLAMSTKINLKGYFPAEVAEASRCIGCRLCAIVCPDVCIEVAVHGVQYSYFQY